GAGDPHAPRRGVEGREELVGLVRLGFRQRVEERGLAGVRVADERDREHLAAHAAATLQDPLLLQLLELALEEADLLGDVAPVELELRLARAAGLAQAAALALEVGPAAHQARREVLQVGELDLELAFARLRALREDLEDELGAVEHAQAELLLQVALLR